MTYGVVSDLILNTTLPSSVLIHLGMIFQKLFYLTENCTFLILTKHISR